MGGPKRRRNLLGLALLVLVGVLLLGGGSLLLHRGAAGASGNVYTLVGERKRQVSRFTLAAGMGRRLIDVKGPLGVTRVEVDGDRARVISSPCRDKICIRFGWLRKAGDFSACLPNKVLVTINEAATSR